MKIANSRYAVALGCFLSIACTIALTMFGLSWYAYVTVDQNTLASQLQAQREVSRMTRDMGQLLQNTTLPLKTLLDATPPTQRTRMWTIALHNALRNTVWLRSLSLVDARGQVIASTNADNIGVMLDIQDWPAYGASPEGVSRIGPAHAGRDLADGVALIDNAKATPGLGYITLSRTHMGHSPNDAPLTLVATLSLDYLIRQITDSADTPSTRISLLRADGLRLLDTRPADAGLLKLERNLVENWRHGAPAESRTFEAVDGRYWIVAANLHNSLPIGLIWAADRELLLADARAKLRQYNTRVIMLMLGINILGIMVWLLFRYTNRHARETLRRSEARQLLLGKAIDACVSAILVTRPDGSIEWVNPAFTLLTGFSAEEATNRKPGELVKSGLQPHAFYHQMWQTILNGQVWRGELINRKKNGSLYDESLTITPMLDDEGKVQHFIAIKEDITARRLAREQLEASHTRLQTVVESFPGGVVMENTQGGIILLNAYLFELFGMLPSEEFTVGRPIFPLTYAIGLLTEDDATFAEHIGELRERARPLYNEELRLKDGRWIERDFVPIRHQDAPIGYLYIYRDVTPRKRHERELWQLATTDSLTGLLNRRAFFEQLERERNRLARYQGEASILMLDIDHFKRVNDTYGHAAGDMMLRHVVMLTNDLLRESDIFGRLGGEEFAILLPATPREGALGIGERIRATLELHPLAYNDNQIPITISIGLSIMTTEDINTEQALSRADRALYAAKRHGRNRVEIG
jgi:diguanylate cyclase (GGDEF)-like protein/PAS domain S-box-containing protein